MQTKKEDLFTTGELASSCCISRKTLLFYDKLGMIHPQFIGRNGYRYYARRQLFTLEMILSLRKLNISLSDIQKYITHKSIDHYKSILIKKEKELDAHIKKLQKIQKDLQYSALQLRHIPKHHFNEVRQQNEPEEYLLVSDSLSKKPGVKQRVAVSAEHFSRVSATTGFTGNFSGYILNKDIFLSGKRPNVQCFFTPIREKTDSPYLRIKPPGLYLTLYFHGIYCSYGEKYIYHLLDFACQKQLPIEDNLYIYSMRNYWTTNDPSLYIYKISLRILSKENRS